MTALPDVIVLLVDDAHAPHPILESAIGELGHCLRRAASAEAHDLADSPDVALVLVMADSANTAGDARTTLDLVARLHQATRAYKTPVIVLAPGAGFPTAEAYAAGALDVMGTPLLAPAIKAKVAFFLDAHRTASRQRRSDAALSDTRAQLETTLKSAELATWTWDVQADRVSADAPMARLFGMSPQRASGSPIAAWVGAIHPDDRARAESGIRNALHTGGVYDVEYRVHDADGVCRDVIARGHIVSDDAGAPALLRGVVIDVTRRKQAEEELRMREERYRTLFDSVDDGVCIIEMLFDEHGNPHDYRFLEMNPAFVKHTGLADAVGKTVRELVPDHDGHWFVTYGRVATTGEPVRFIDEAQALGRWYDVYAARVGGPDSAKVAVLFTDISARIKADAQLRRLAADLSEADRRKTEFLATLAHELRNPLAPIRSGLQVMRLAMGEPATMARVQDVMERQLNHMVALVDDLLDIARITRGQVELKLDAVDVQQVLASAIETSLPMIEAEQHRLELDITGRRLTLHADPTRIRQVVSNLLNNAAKYTPRGGRIALSAQVDGADLVIAVSDNGVGIDDASLEAVFDMFNQVGRERHRTRGGLGIGLSLVRSLVALHGGSVTAASAGVGQGSVFTVRLPLASAPQQDQSQEQSQDQQPERTPAPASVLPAAAAGLRILVVDDNHDAAATLAELLELIGHRADVANGAREALDKAPALAPQVMFLDIGMPGMNGYELARALRQDGQFDQVLLVALTGWGGEDDRARTREAGFDVHLTKPVNLDAVATLLATHGKRLAGA